MELTTDIPLRGIAWNKVIDQLSSVFKTRTHYTLYILSLSIGLMYDKRIERPEDDGAELKTVPRLVVSNNDNGKLDVMFQAAILSTATEQLSEDDRLDLAFGEKTEFNKIGFLTQFANYGVTKLAELIGDTILESMENIKDFLVSTVEGRNFDIDALPDDILLSEDL